MRFDQPFDRDTGRSLLDVDRQLDRCVQRVRTVDIGVLLCTGPVRRRRRRVERCGLAESATWSRREFDVPIAVDDVRDASRELEKRPPAELVLPTVTRPMHPDRRATTTRRKNRWSRPR